MVGTLISMQESGHDPVPGTGTLPIWARAGDMRVRVKGGEDGLLHCGVNFSSKWKSSEGEFGALE